MGPSLRGVHTRTMSSGIAIQAQMGAGVSPQATHALAEMPHARSPSAKDLSSKMPRWHSDLSCTFAGWRVALLLPSSACRESSAGQPAPSAPTSKADRDTLRAASSLKLPANTASDAAICSCASSAKTLPSMARHQACSRSTGAAKSSPVGSPSSERAARPMAMISSARRSPVARIPPTNLSSSALLPHAAVTWRASASPSSTGLHVARSSATAASMSSWGSSRTVAPGTATVLVRDAATRCICPVDALARASTSSRMATWSDAWVEGRFRLVCMPLYKCYMCTCSICTKLQLEQECTRGRATLLLGRPTLAPSGP